MHPSQKIFAFVFSLCFLALLSLPSLSLLLNIAPHDTYTIQENRLLAKKPEFSVSHLGSMPAKLDAYFNDRLGYRNYFLGNYIYIWEKLLQSPVNQYVTGNNGELFMNHAAPIVDAALGIIPKQQKELELLRLAAAGMTAYFYLKDIPYYLFLIPDKPTLYPEALPFYSNFTQHDGWYSALQATLENANISFFSFREYLFPYSRQFRLYDKLYDVEHWNGNAIDLAYKKMADILMKDNAIFTPLSSPYYYSLENKEVQASVFGKEIVPYININNIEHVRNITGQLPVSNISPYYTALYENTHNKKGSLWFFTDSYFNATHGLSLCTPFIHNVRYLLQTHYQEVTLSWCEQILQQYRPDAVIETFVERAGLLAHRSSQDPELRILGDIWLQTPGYLIDDSTLRSTQVENATLMRNSRVQTIHALNNDPLLLFPPISTDAYGRAVVMASMNAPADTVARLYYKENGTFNEEESVACPVKKGDNIIHLSINTTPHSTVFLRFDPGMLPGEYRFLPLPVAEQLKEKISHGI